MGSTCSRGFFMVSKTVATGIAALVLVMPVRLTTSLIMSSLIKAASPTKDNIMIRLGLTTCQAMPRRTHPENLTKTEFCRACAKFPTGVTIVTVLDAEGSPHGMTASSFTSVPLQPPLVLVCVVHRPPVLPHLRRAQPICINTLTENHHDL